MIDIQSVADFEDFKGLEAHVRSLDIEGITWDDAPAKIGQDAFGGAPTMSLKLKGTKDASFMVVDILERVASVKDVDIRKLMHVKVKEREIASGNNAEQFPKISKQDTFEVPVLGTAAPVTKRIRQRSVKAGAVVTKKGRADINISDSPKQDKPKTRKVERREKRATVKKMIDLLETQEKRIALLRRQLGQPKGGKKGLATVEGLKLSDKLFVGVASHVLGSVVTGSGKTRRSRALNDIDDSYIWYRDPGRIQVGIGDTYIPTTLDIGTFLYCECEIDCNKRSRNTVELSCGQVEVDPSICEIITGIILGHKEHLFEVELNGNKTSNSDKCEYEQSRVRSGSGGISDKSKRRFTISLPGASGNTKVDNDVETIVVAKEKIKYRVGKKTVAKMEVGSNVWALPLANNMHDFVLNMGDEQFMLSAKETSMRDVAVITINSVCGRAELSRVIKMEAKNTIARLATVGMKTADMDSCGARGLKYNYIDEEILDRKSIEKRKQMEKETQISKLILSDLRLNSNEFSSSVSAADWLLNDGIISNADRTLLLKLVSGDVSLPPPVIDDSWEEEDIMMLFDTKNNVNDDNSKDDDIVSLFSGSAVLNSPVVGNLTGDHRRSISIGGGFGSLADMTTSPSSSPMIKTISPPPVITPPKTPTEQTKHFYDPKASSPGDNAVGEGTITTETLPALYLDESKTRGNFVWDRRSKLWFNRSTKYLFNEKTKLYCKSTEGPWFRYDKETMELVQVSPK